VKILLIASTDSYNFSLPRLFACFKEKGHQVTLMQTEFGREHNFAIKGLPVKKYFGVIRDLESYDFAVFENVLNKKLLKQLHDANVFCVSMFFHAFPTQYIMGAGYLYGNLTFSLGENFKQTQRRNGVIQEIIPTGSPQYDDIEINSRVKGKTFLFLEQHFYPAGDKGKCQLATALIESAENNPDYKIIVKPRTLPKYNSQSKHKSRHIYSYIETQCEGELPDNLVLLREHMDLLGLINSSCVVATTFSTAIYPCLIADKAVIWVAGFDSDDIHYYNKKVIDSYYSQYSETNNVIHYSELKEYVTAAKPVNKNVVNSIIYKADRHSAERITEILEFISRSVSGHNKLLPYLDLSYENYQQKITEYIARGQKEDNGEISYSHNLNREYNTCLDHFYRFYMTAGYAKEDIFSELKTKLTAIQSKYLNYSNAYRNANDLYRMECEDCTSETIKKYADVLNQGKQLSDDFKSTYIRWLYEKEYYKELRQLSVSFFCVDYELYTTLIKYKYREIGEETLIKELERLKVEQKKTDFPRTLFYTAVTINEIEKYLALAYLRKGYILRYIATVLVFSRRNRSDIVKKIFSGIYRLLPNIR
jgi:hypothetical protein